MIIKSFTCALLIALIAALATGANARTVTVLGGSVEACNDWRNDADQAITACTRLLNNSTYQKDKTNLARIYVLRGRAYRGTMDDERAIADYTSAIKLQPRSAKAYELRGIIYNHRANDKTVEAAIGPLMADYGEIERKFAENKFQEALDALAAAEKEGANVPAKTLKELRDDMEKARKELATWPTTPQQIAAKKAEIAAMVQTRKENFERAIRDFDLTIQYTKDTGEELGKLYSIRGHAHQFIGNWERCISDESQAIRLLPPVGDGKAETIIRRYNTRGNCYLRLKDYAKARADYNEVIKLDPVNYPAKTGLEEIEQAIKDATVPVPPG